MPPESGPLQVSVPCDPHAPAAVRHAMSALCGTGPILGDALLVASELVTNAVRHSRGTGRDTLQIQVDRTPHQLRVTVQDPGRADSEARIIAPGEIPSGGLGLRIVEELSSRWGAERSDGYLVWAEVPLVAPAREI